MEQNQLTFERVGTLGDFVTKKQDLLVDDINLADVEKQIYVKFEVNKERKTAILSWPITKMLRSKRIALGNIFDFPMSLSSDGLYSIHNEEREMRAIKREKCTVMKITKVEVKQEDLIVW